MTRSLSYRACVFGGVIAGVAIAAPFASRAGLTPLLWIAIAAFAICVALALGALTKVVFAGETFSFLHYQLGVIGATTALLASMDAPLLPSLDLLGLALAVTQAIGRIGCATTGCCHGRPFRIGIRYDVPRVAEHWSGARLFPVQWIESCALFLIAIAVARAIDVAPGRAFILYATAYAAIRFTLELFRGDMRRHLLGISEAQWICVLTAMAMAIWQRGFTIVIAVMLVTAALVLHRAHRIDFDSLARAVFAARTSPEVASAAGVRISHGSTADAEHYTISASRPLTPRDAGSLAAFVRDLAHPDRSLQLLPGNSGVFHIIVGGSA